MYNSLIWEYFYASIQLLLVPAAIDLSGNLLSHTSYATWDMAATGYTDFLMWQFIVEIYNDYLTKGECFWLHFDYTPFSLTVFGWILTTLHLL